MPRAPRPLILALLAATLVLGPASAAGASDDGLRTLVALSGPARDGVERDLRSVGPIPTTSVAAAARSLARAAEIHARVRRDVGELRDAFRTETADTPLADEGRDLVLSGLRDVRIAVGRLARADRVAARRLSRTRSEATVRRTAREYGRDSTAATRLAEKGAARAERGGRLIVLAR